MSESSDSSVAFYLIVLRLIIFLAVLASVNFFSNGDGERPAEDTGEASMMVDKVFFMSLLFFVSEAFLFHY